MKQKEMLEWMDRLKVHHDPIAIVNIKAAIVDAFRRKELIKSIEWVDHDDGIHDSCPSCRKLIKPNKGTVRSHREGCKLWEVLYK